MGKIEKILKKGPVEGQTTEVYPVTSTKAVYDENNKRLDNIITGLQESVYLNTPIPISTENTPEANAQNVENITNYIEKAKAAGIEDVNGMAVTCLIDDDYSGVGYFYGNSNAVIQGITITDALIDNAVFSVNEGHYYERFVILEGDVSIVDSDMLNEGARKPIILTPETTEVDEETYQKLLYDDVDVVFKASDGKYCVLTYKKDSTSSKGFCFSCLSIEGKTMGDTYIYAYIVDIKGTAPHTCKITTLYDASTIDEIIGTEFIHKSILSPVLQEIDLIGTDADRKAKLDQFETDWKALTGASDLKGARFVGVYEYDFNYVDAIFMYDSENQSWVGIASQTRGSEVLTKAYVNQDNGSITITPLFSHLEGITLKAGNTNTDMAVNVATIKVYINNLKALGVDTTKGFMVSVNVNLPSDSGYYGYMASHYVQGSYFLSGTIFKNDAGENKVKNITINPMGRYDEIVSTAS